MAPVSQAVARGGVGAVPRQHMLNPMRLVQLVSAGVEVLCAYALFESQCRLIPCELA